MVQLSLEPTQLSDPKGDLVTQKTKLKQGGLFGGKPTITFHITHLDGTFESTYLVSELREALDILEPLPKKRERKKPAKAKAAEVLSQVITPKETFRG